MEKTSCIDLDKGARNTEAARARRSDPRRGLLPELILGSLLYLETDGGWIIGKQSSFSSFFPFSSAFQLGAYQHLHA